MSALKVYKDMIHERINHLLRSAVQEKRDTHLHIPHEQGDAGEPVDGTHSPIHWWIDQSSILVSTPQINRDVIHEL